MLNPCNNCDFPYWSFKTCICNLKILYDIEKRNIPLDKPASPAERGEKIIPVKKKDSPDGGDKEVPLKIKLGRV